MLLAFFAYHRLIFLQHANVSKHFRQTFLHAFVPLYHLCQGRLLSVVQHLVDADRRRHSSDRRPRGSGAQIGQDVVLVGSLPFMRSMGVHMSDGARVRQAVYVSVNGELAGIFAVKYKPSASTRAGLRALLANPGNSVILATRDFLITPELLAARYELAVGGIAFPVYSERLRLSEAVGGEADAQGALIAKETFGAFASAGEPV